MTIAIVSPRIEIGASHADETREHHIKHLIVHSDDTTDAFFCCSILFLAPSAARLRTSQVDELCTVFVDFVWNDSSLMRRAGVRGTNSDSSCLTAIRRSYVFLARATKAQELQFGRREKLKVNGSGTGTNVMQ